MSLSVRKVKPKNDLSYKNDGVLRYLYHEKGMSGSQVADRLNCGTQTVFRWMEKFGIERQDKIEAIKEHKTKNYATYRMNESGHYAWIAAHDGKNEKMYVARLLAICEYGADAVIGKHVHHKNGIPWDNRAENIELLTPAEHKSHHTKGELHPNSKLTEQDARQIKSMYENTGKTQKEVAVEFGVCHQNVSDIMNGKLWAHAFE